MRPAHRQSPATIASVIALAITAWVLSGLQPVRAAEPAVPSAADCVRILEAWALDPKGVALPAVAQCKAMAAALPQEPLAPAEPPVPTVDLAALDPCSGAGAANNVLCWGPWVGFAPAAGAPPVTVAGTDLRLPDRRPELADDLTPGVDPAPPVLPLGACAPGTPCGFATVVTGVTSSDVPEQTEFARIDLAADGESFVIRRLDGSLIASVPAMGTVIIPRADGFDGLRATGRSGDEQSRLVARIVRGDDGEIILAADVWSHGNRTSGPVNSGYFAWGVATSQAGLDSLNAGNVSATFTGPMSVNNATTATMTLNFGSQPNWTGSWVNPAYAFSAGGTIAGADLISVPGQFSANVVGSQNLVQGAVVGEAGNRGVAHLIDVTLAGQGLVRDVGLLREVTQAPIQP
jgi:hypothetical protein